MAGVQQKRWVTTGVGNSLTPYSRQDGGTERERYRLANAA